MKTSAALAALFLLTACAGTPEPVTTPLSPAELDVAANESTCARGTLPDERIYIVCENGVTRLPVFRAALNGPVDEALDIEQVANKFAVAPQIFTGIEPATYSALVPKNRKAIAPAKASSPYDSVTVDGKVFDVYRVGLGETVGTVFVQRRTKSG